MSEAKIEVDVKITPEMMAEAFWKMSPDEQARFSMYFQKKSAVINFTQNANGGIWTMSFPRMAAMS